MQGEETTHKGSGGRQVGVGGVTRWFQLVLDHQTAAAISTQYQLTVGRWNQKKKMVRTERPTPTHFHSCESPGLTVHSRFSLVR